MSLLNWFIKHEHVAFLNDDDGNCKALQFAATQILHLVIEQLALSNNETIFKNYT